MKKHEFIEFEKRYEKFKKNNLLPLSLMMKDKLLSTFTILIVYLIMIIKNT